MMTELFQQKAASIKANDLIVVVNTYSGYGGTNLDYKAKEYMFAGSVDNITLGEALIAALAASRHALTKEDPELFDYRLAAQRYKEWVERALKFTGVKTKAKLFKPMYSVGAESSNGIIELVPSLQEKLDGWGGVGLRSNSVKIPADSSPEKVGEAVRLALSRSQSVYSQRYYQED